MMAFIRLSDGRRLAFAEYGDPVGKPVFLFHGAPGSRFFRPPFDDRTRALGVRLITVDRPGFGESDYQPGRRIPDWPADVCELADSLGIGKFAVAGHSAGGPYALACAALIPGRLTAAATVSGLGPVDAPGALDGIRRRNRLGFLYGRHLPALFWTLGVWLLFHRAKDHPEEFVHADQIHPDPDNAMLTLPGVLEMCQTSTSMALRHGVGGFAREAFLLSRPWRVPLSQIPIPVHIWHGTADQDAPLGMAQAVARAVPNGQLRIFPGEGHLLIMRHWEELLRLLTTG
jgi:pimeloyl-ACP methyl ester carboxylesterase